MKIYCATTNAGKLREFRLAARPPIGFEPLPAIVDKAVTPCEETGFTFEENAVQKARYYGAHCDGYLIAEDSGLEVDALGGAPGVFSARFAGEGASDEQNNNLLLEKLRLEEHRAAQYVCVIALARDGRVIRTFRGEVQGWILHEPRGTRGFGYDPLFFYEPFGCSFGEVPEEMKQAVSHRGAALRELCEYLLRDGG